MPHTVIWPSDSLAIHAYETTSGPGKSGGIGMIYRSTVQPLRCRMRALLVAAVAASVSCAPGPGPLRAERTVDAEYDVKTGRL